MKACCVTLLWPNLILSVYRKLAALAGMTMDRVPNKNPLAALDEEKREHELKVVGLILGQATTRLCCMIALLLLFYVVNPFHVKSHSSKCIL